MSPASDSKINVSTISKINVADSIRTKCWPTDENKCVRRPNVKINVDLDCGNKCCPGAKINVAPTSEITVRSGLKINVHEGHRKCENKCFKINVWKYNSTTGEHKRLKINVWEGREAPITENRNLGISCLSNKRK